MPAVPATPESDTAVLAAVAAGDPVAFGEFYDRFAGRVYSLVRGLCDDAVAAEVHQDVFRTVWRTAAEFDPALGPPASWLLDLAHATAVVAARSGAPGRDEPVLTDQVRAVLADLPPTQAAVLVRAYYGARSLRDVASLLGLPAASVGTHAHDAVTGLRPGAGRPGR